VSAAWALLALGCSGSGSDAPKKEETTPPETISQVPPTPVSTLKRAQSCDDLSQAIKGDALRKMNDTIDAQIESIKLWFDGQFGGGGIVAGGATDGRGGEANAGSASPGAPPPPSGSGSGSGSSSASQYSETNTQVKGVDEADIVKNDGQYIYLLHGNSFQILTAWPAQALAAAGKVDIEGRPSEMFVANGKAVVFSAVNGASVYQATGLRPRSRYSDPYGGYNPACYDGYSCQLPLTKVTVLGIAGTSAAVERELYFEGTYKSSRRVDANVRVVVQDAAYGPAIKTYPEMRRDPQAPAPGREDYIKAYEALRQQNVAAINQTSLADWLPYSFEKTPAGITSTLATCGDFFVPTEATTQHGVTQIASFQLDKPQAPAKGVSILGAVDTIYSNADAMILAARAWISPKKMVERPQGRKAPFVDFMPSSATYLHKFDLKTDPTAPAYVGSGVIPGHVLNQFSIDERDGVVRAATTEQRQVRSWVSDDPKVRPFFNAFTVNRVVAVKQQGDVLKMIGDAGDLAPGERVFSARFVGSKGYVVTFRQIDPLFVIDLANPEKLKVLGELKIPGFSEYMHPLDEGHLLTIGRDTENNVRRGLALQIFDVTKATEPRLMHKYAFDPSSYGYSEAEQSHKAFTYFEAKKLLSFPYYGYGTGGAGGFRTSAELFSIDLEKGINKVGAVDHTQLFGANARGYCNGYYSPYVRRSVFMDDVMYSISYAGVIASDTRALSSPPLATASLLAPKADGMTCQ
jgi:hypothetical protein